MLKAIIKIVGFFVGFAERVKNIRRQKKDDKLTEEMAELLTDPDKPDNNK